MLRQRVLHLFNSLSSTSVLMWPAWLRLLAVLPALALLWLLVAWASVELAPW